MDAPVIKVLVVDDSPIALKLFTHLINTAGGMVVVGTAMNGEEAVAFLRHGRPDVILMDIQMPVMNGFEATRRIMETDPVPIVICSASSHQDDVEKTFRAVEAGAVAFVGKPAGPGHPEFRSSVDNMVQTVRLMAGVRPLRRSAACGLSMAAGILPDPGPVVAVPRMVAIGASTGGPLALQTILSLMPVGFPLPVMVVQHIVTGFVEGLRDWLAESSVLPVEVAQNGAVALPGHVYLAPDDFHMGLDEAGRVVLAKTPPEHGLRPSVSSLFRSVTLNYGPAAVGILLSGMGKDGAMDLKQMRDQGAITIAQDRESALIHGMAGEAIRLGAASHILPPSLVPVLLAKVVGVKGYTP